MNFTGSNFNSCGCGNRDSGCGCPTNTPTYQQCNQVVQTCNVEDIPHYTNYHTHVVLNLTGLLEKALYLKSRAFKNF